MGAQLERRTGPGNKCVLDEETRDVGLKKLAAEEEMKVKVVSS